MTVSQDGSKQGMAPLSVQKMRAGAPGADRELVQSVRTALDAAMEIRDLLAGAIRQIETAKTFTPQDLSELRERIDKAVSGAKHNGHNWVVASDTSVSLGQAPSGGRERTLKPVALTLDVNGLALPDAADYTGDPASVAALKTVLERARNRADEAVVQFEADLRFGQARLQDSAVKSGPADRPNASAEKIENPWIENIKTIAIALAIAIVIRTFLFQPFNIPSGSMISTLDIGDYLFVSKFSYGYSQDSFPFGLVPLQGRIFGSEPDRGDVIVFKNVRDNNKDYVKRMIGMPGDEIQVISGVVHINGTPVQRRQVGEYKDWNCNGTRVARAPVFEETLPNGKTYTTIDAVRGAELDDTRVFRVPEGHYFMMGDNRDCSSDSRVTQLVGPIPYEQLVGKAQIIFFSVNGQKAQLWQIWRWPVGIRWGRILRPIR